jgi:Fibronectin type III domain
MPQWRVLQLNLIIGAVTLLCLTAAPAADFRVLLLENGVPVWTERSDPAIEAGTRTAASPDAAMAATLERMVAAQLAGPTALEATDGLVGLFSPGSSLDSVMVSEGHGTVRLTLPETFLQDRLDDRLFEEIVHLTVNMDESTEGLQSLSLLARAPGETEYRPLSEYLPLPPPNDKPETEQGTSGEPGPGTSHVGQPPMSGQGQPTGALTGASIFLSPGHGWYYNHDVLFRWATQRGNNNNLIEDLSNGEAVLQYLVPYLWNAGARVYTVRERDLQTNEVIIDNGGTGHSETGSWSTQTPSDGFYGTNMRAAMTVTGTPTATSTFTPDIPEDGHYAVTVWYRSSTTGTTTADARFTVNHTGGSTTWVQNETRDGWTWKNIGTYYFEAGVNPATGSVVIDNQSATAGRYVVADAVRFGGGMGSLIDPNGGGLSGEPRWEESGRYHRVFMGDNTWAGTVWAMPQYADWECEDGWEGGSNNNAIYVSWHTNAGGGTGTSSFAYSSAGSGGAFDGVAGGDILRNTIHAELINDITAGWDSGWTDRGTKTANFGEINPGNNNDMPASLHEMAFHDLPADADDIKEPNFRRLCARAVYQGIVKFYHDYFYSSQGNGEFNDDTLLPEPPTNLRALNAGGGSVSLAWDAPPSDTGDDLLGDPATGYRVYQSSNGRGFDNGTAAAVTSATVSGLTPGDVIYFRVSATNAGGESFPTETLAVRVRSSGTPPILIVNGFDRLDRDMNIFEDDPYDADPAHRGYLWLMNTYDHIIAHAEAIDARGIDFDSCANEAIIDSQVSLGSYDTVVWICGEESDPDDTLSATEQSRLTSYFGGGGRLFISGAEIAWELDSLNRGRSFCENSLHANSVGNDAGVYAATGSTGSIFDGFSLTFDDGSSIYDVDLPDVIDASAGSAVALEYSGSSPTTLHDFDAIGGWRDPNYSGQTNAETDSTFTIVGTPLHEGSGSGDLYYHWGSGDFIREYNSDLDVFPAASDLSLWVYGDGSGHELRIAVRDDSDSDIAVNAYTTINFTGWQEIVWTDIATNHTLWSTGGNGVLDGPTVRLDSIQVNKVTATDTGHIFLDDATYTLTGGSGGGAAIQWTDGVPGGGRVVMLGFPFETITSVSVRNQVMAAALNFFGGPVPVELSVFRAE